MPVKVFSIVPPADPSLFLHSRLTPVLREAPHLHLHHPHQMSARLPVIFKQTLFEDEICPKSALLLA